MGATQSKSENLPEHRRFFQSKRFPRLIRRSKSNIEGATDVEGAVGTVRNPFDTYTSSSSNRRMSLGSSAASYPYPRGHRTLLVPANNCTTRLNADDQPVKKSGKNLRGRGPSFGKRFFGKTGASANLHIPSPVLSCSEPSTADNSLSVSRSETNEFHTTGAEFVEKLPELRGLTEEALSNLKIVESSQIPTTSLYSCAEQAGHSGVGTSRLMFDTSGNNNQEECAIRPASFNVTVSAATTAAVSRAPKKSILKQSHSLHCAVTQTETVPRAEAAQEQEIPAVKQNFALSSSDGFVQQQPNSRLARPTNFKGVLPQFKGPNQSSVSEEGINRNDSSLSVVDVDNRSLESGCAKESSILLNTEKNRKVAKFKNPVKSGFAPLAESESFIVENSPAVELPPIPSGGQLYAVTGAGNRVTSKIMPLTKSNLPRSNLHKITFKVCEGTSKNSGGGNNVRNKPLPVDPSKKVAHFSALPTKISNFAESRLKNAANYNKMQSTIYGKFDKNRENVAEQPSSCEKVVTSSEDNIVFVVTDENANSTAPQCTAAQSESKIADDINNPKCMKFENGKAKAKEKADKDIVGCKIISSNNIPTCTIIKMEMVDSGVKSCDSSMGSDASVSNSKMDSPDGSVHRGLIDDEIRDQPELTVGTQSDQTSLDQALVTADNVSASSDRTIITGGPIRNRCHSHRRSGVDRMTESCDSTISSTASVDGDDLMLDYDLRYGGDSANEMTDSYHSMCESLHRQQQQKAGLPNSRVRTMSHSKRASADGLMDEYNRLVNEINKNSSQSRSSLNNKSSAADLAGSTTVTVNHHHHHHKPLKFPTPISEDLTNSAVPITVDPHTYRHLVQDVTVVKTLLFRLKRVLQEADTVNPFENALAIKQNGYLKQSLDELINSGDTNAAADFTKEDFREENSALRTQVALMRQQIEEKDSIIAEQKARIEELERLCNQQTNAGKHGISAAVIKPLLQHRTSETMAERLPDLLTARSDVTLSVERVE